MVITPVVTTVNDLTVVTGPARSAGLHVSSIIKAILLRLEPERFGGELDHNRIQLGFTVERVIEEAWRARRVDVIRPGEIVKDGIAGSPDGVRFDEAGAIVEEIKCTWMSNRGCPDDKKFIHWLWQIKAYCHLLDTRRARLSVFFVNGDYAKNREPQFCAWDLAFHDGEIAENWMMLTTQAQELRAKGGT
jgi:hypothetical protein